MRATPFATALAVTLLSASSAYAVEPGPWKVGAMEFGSIEAACVQRGLDDCASAGTTCTVCGSPTNPFTYGAGATGFPFVGAYGAWCSRCGGTNTVARFCPTVAGGFRTIWDGVSDCKCEYDYNYDAATNSCVADCPPGKRAFQKQCVDPRDDPGNNGQPCPFCGDPIHPGAGIHFQEEPLYVGAGPFPLRVTLRYNSRSISGAVDSSLNLGSPWVSEHQRKLRFVGALGASPPTVVVTLADGKVLRFSEAANGVDYTQDVNVNGQLKRLKSGATTLGWQYVSAEGDETDTFDAYGSYLSTTNRQGLTITLGYTDGSGGFYYSPTSPTGTVPFPPSYVAPTCAPPAGFAFQLDVQGQPVVPPNPRLACMVDAMGRQLNFQTDVYGRLVQMADPAGGRYLFEYDGLTANRRPTSDPGHRVLTKVTFPDGHTRLFHYNEPQLLGSTDAGCPSLPEGLPEALTGLTDENGNRFATWSYDCLGRATSSELAGHVNRSTLAYDTPDAGLTLVTETLGNASAPLTTSRIYAFAVVAGRLVNVAITDPVSGAPRPCIDCGQRSSSVLDANGNAAAFLDWNGNQTCVAYDLVRNLELNRLEGLPSTADCATLLAAAAPTLPTPARRVTTQWSADWRLPTVITEPRRKTTFAYGGPNDLSPGNRGSLLSKTEVATTDVTGASGAAAVTTGLPRTWTYTYDGDGRVLTVDGPRTDLVDVTTYTYFPDNHLDVGKRGNLATLTDELGHVTQFTAYDAHGQLLTTVDPNGVTTTFTYDARRRVTSVQLAGLLTSYAYDGAGQLTEVNLPDGTTLSSSYDSAHRLTGITDNLGNRVTATLDNRGNRIQEQRFDPSSTLVQTRAAAFDALNRVTQALGAQGQTTAYAYDTNGNLVSQTDPLNRVTTSTYDALNQLASMTMPSPGGAASMPVTSLQYDGSGRVTRLTDPRSVLTTYSFDGLGNSTGITSADTGASTKTFDAAGNVLTSTDGKGQVTSYTYDAANRVLTVVFGSATGAQLKTITHTYDQGPNGLGHLTGVAELDANSNPIETTQLQYDARGSLVSEAWTAGVTHTTTSARDATTGLLTSMTYPSGRVVSYTYDGVGRVIGITTRPAGGTDQVLVSAVTYQPFGDVKGYTLGNGRIVTRTFDLDGRIASYTLGSRQWNVTYDVASRLSGLVDAANASNAVSYGYDGLDRLTQATTPLLSSLFAYDLGGNRTSRTLGSATETSTLASTSNRLTQVSGSRTRSFIFDSNGSTTDDGDNQYAYDARGRLNSVVSTRGSTSFTFDAQGRRTRKSGTADTVFHYDPSGHLLAEYSAAGVLKREYFYLGDLPVAVLVAP